MIVKPKQSAMDDIFDNPFKNGPPDVDVDDELRSNEWDCEDKVKRPSQIIQRHQKQIAGRYFHGILTFIGEPEMKYYFILDSKTGHLSVFNTLEQSKSS